MLDPTGNDIQFRREIFLAMLVTGLACAAGFSNLLLTSNDLYPTSTDALGHMAKIRYIAECLQDGILPSWFPFWYNGAAATQYYPPLSYYLMAPVYILTDNIMLTFKIGCFTAIFLGGLGVWFYCRAFIGKWCGLFGSVAFCLQPYILLTLLSQGQVAQGPIIALTPWYLTLLLFYIKKPNTWKFIAITFLCAIMILSHPNSIFMNAICIMITLTAFLILRWVSFQSYFLIGISVVFAGILTAFWSLVGVTGLENPEIPKLLGEAAMTSTATADWFLLPTNFFYFAIPVSVGSLAAIFLFAYSTLYKKIRETRDFFVLFAILITCTSAVFSFGLRLPLFKYIPLAENFVAGRILCLTSVSAAILCAYLLYKIQSVTTGKKIILRLFSFSICMLIMTAILYYMNPYSVTYGAISDESFKLMISHTDESGANFEKGRYMFIGPFDCRQTFFPLQYNFNMSEGYNIEGTTHNQIIWGEVTAIASGKFSYIAKNLAFWNVRYLLLDERAKNVIKGFDYTYDFQDDDLQDGNNFFVSKVPSSYYLTDHRNALLIGPGASGLAMEFPYLVYEQRQNIWDYSLEELSRFDLIYLCEPEINTINEKERIERILVSLVNKGIRVIIEPSGMNNYPIFGVTASDLPLESRPTLQKQNNAVLKNSMDHIELGKKIQYGRMLFGLDKAYYKLEQNRGQLENDIIGEKNVSNGNVLFIGLHLSQYLKAVYAKNWGAPKTEAGYPDSSDDLKLLFEDIFDAYKVNKEFWPKPFPVEKAEWNYKGADFDYKSAERKSLTVSLTYTPRWHVTVDGDPIIVGQRENLVMLDLPAGEHHVKLTYGVTKYGIAGYIISLIGLMFFILFIKFYGIILYYFKRISSMLKKFLQLRSE